MKSLFVNDKAEKVFVESCEAVSLSGINEKSEADRMAEARAAVKELLGGGAQEDEIKSAVKELLNGTDEGPMTEARDAVKEALYGENR